MIIDDRQFTDTLFEVVEQSMKFIVSHISVAFEFDGSIQRKERFAYPLPALREALLNAVVHRSYIDPSDIQIKIFDDKITLFSPGTFYGGLTVARYGPTTTAPACATNSLPKASTSSMRSKNTAADSSASAAHSTTIRRFNSTSRKSSAASWLRLRRKAPSRLRNPQKLPPASYPQVTPQVTRKLSTCWRSFKGK
ncbi:MAG: hypothetical protein IPN06_11040 [Burkholderiales bacterium]|nr:hypothetical protein [Burkholderiales bacterium]